MKGLIATFIILFSLNSSATCNTQAEELALKNAIRNTELGSEGDASWVVFTTKKKINGEVTKQIAIDAMGDFDYLDEISGSYLSGAKSASAFFADEIEVLEEMMDEYKDAKIDVENYKRAKNTFETIFGDDLYFLEVFEGDEDDGVGVYEKIIFGIKPDGCVVGMKSAEFWT